jgi:hypothetical protein
VNRDTVLKPITQFARLSCKVVLGDLPASTVLIVEQRM